MGRHTNPETGVVFEVDDSKDDRYASADAAPVAESKAAPLAEAAPKKAARK